jgi:hypothetical protein
MEPAGINSDNTNNTNCRPPNAHGWLGAGHLHSAMHRAASATSSSSFVLTRLLSRAVTGTVSLGVQVHTKEGDLQLQL